MKAVGAWSCRACATEIGAHGHGFSNGGWCAVGGHRTKERIEYFPAARSAATPKVERVPEEVPPGTQLALL